jgi:hypothetical protein
MTLKDFLDKIEYKNGNNIIIEVISEYGNQDLKCLVIFRSALL